MFHKNRGVSQNTPNVMLNLDQHGGSEMREVWSKLFNDLVFSFECSFVQSSVADDFSGGELLDFKSKLLYLSYRPGPTDFHMS